MQINKNVSHSMIIKVEKENIIMKERIWINHVVQKIHRRIVSHEIRVNLEIENLINIRKVNSL